MQQFFDFDLKIKYTSLPIGQKFVLKFPNLSLVNHETNEADFKQGHDRKILGMRIRQTIQTISCD